MGKTRYNKDVRDAIKAAQQQGFSLVQSKSGGSHVKMVHSNGGTITFPSTPKSYSWLANHRADVKRVAAGRRPSDG